MNRADLRRYILLIAGRMVKWSTVDRLSAKWGFLHVTLPPVDQTEGEEVNTQPARDMIGFGFRSAPVAGSEVIVAAPRAGATNATVIASDSLGHGPTDLSEGDAVQYSSAHAKNAAGVQQTCFVKTAATGDITVTAKTGQEITILTSNGTIKIDGVGKITIDSAAGTDVQVNGGELRVGRLTDPVNSTGTFATWLNNLRVAVTVLGGADVGVPPSQIGTIAGGAARFKA